MAQMKLTAFARTLPKPATLPSETYEEKIVRHKKECERLGLEWPRPTPKQCRGRPKFETWYKEELYKLIWENSLPAMA
eukprot:4776390-Amphidinium_carterae.3